MTRIYGDIILPNRCDPDNVLKIDMGCLPLLSMMENAGMKISTSYLSDLHKTITSEMEELEEKAAGLVGKHININSGDQLSDLLFKELRLKQPGKEKRTKVAKRLSVDADVLKGMVAQHPVINVYLDWKEREKLRSTYTVSLIHQVDSNSRVHPDLIHTGPETGRIACKSPNLENIPVRTKLGKQIRCAFIPEHGNVLGAVDLSQIEFRQAGEDAHCAGLLDIYTQGLDLYWQIAEAVYERTYSEEDRKGGVNPESGLTYKEEHRQNAKVIALGTLYDISPEGLVDQLLVSKAVRFLSGGDALWNPAKYYAGAVEKCRTAIRNFFVRFPELLTARRIHHKTAIRTGMVWDMFGRHRWIPQVFSTHQWIVGEGLRAAGNFRIQAAAAGILKIWMAVVHQRIVEYWGKHGVIPLMVVHDELDCEGPKSVLEDFLQEAAELVTILMPLDLYSTPLKASFGVADSWGLIQK